MKRQLAALGALTLGISGAASLGLTAAPASASGSSQRFDLHSVSLSLRYADAVSQFVGKDANHPVVGDAFVDTSPLREQRQVVGHATNICTIVTGTSEATFITQCASTYTLRDGEFTTAGADDNSDTTTDAVTGGTGAYAYAAGTATTVSGSSAATVTIRYVITR